MSGASVVRLAIRLTLLLSIPSRAAISFKDFASPDSSTPSQRWPLASASWMDVQYMKTAKAVAPRVHVGQRHAGGDVRLMFGPKGKHGEAIRRMHLAQIAVGVGERGKAARRRAVVVIQQPKVFGAKVEGALYPCRETGRRACVAAHLHHIHEVAIGRREFAFHRPVCAVVHDHDLIHALRGQGIENLVQQGTASAVGNGDSHDFGCNNEIAWMSRHVIHFGHPVLWNTGLYSN